MPPRQNNTHSNRPNFKRIYRFAVLVCIACDMKSIIVLGIHTAPAAQRRHTKEPVSTELLIICTYVVSIYLTVYQRPVEMHISTIYMN